MHAPHQRSGATLLAWASLIVLAVGLVAVGLTSSTPQAQAAYNSDPPLVGEGYTQYGRDGTLNTSAVFDVTGDPKKLATAFSFKNDGSSTVRIEAVASVAAMTVNSHPVLAGELYTSPVRARKYTAICTAGTTCAYRVFAAH